MDENGPHRRVCLRCYPCITAKHLRSVVAKSSLTIMYIAAHQVFSSHANFESRDELPACMFRCAQLQRSD